MDGQEPGQGIKDSPGSSEKTPLIQDEPQQQGAESRIHKDMDKLMAYGETVYEKGAESVQLVLDSLIRTKNAMRTSPWILSSIVAFCCVALTTTGVIEVLGYAITFRVVSMVIKFYQVLFGTAALFVEAVRFTNIFNGKSFINTWMPFLELILGRGLLHLLTAGLALTSDRTVVKCFPGLLLAIVATLEIVWGIRSAIKVRQLMSSLKTEMSAVGAFEPGDNMAGLKLLERKFHALDLNGDGRLTKDELEAGAESLNLQLLSGEIDMIFQLLDPQGKGYVSIADLEVWWINAKNPFAGGSISIPIPPRLRAASQMSAVL